MRIIDTLNEMRLLLPAEAWKPTQAALTSIADDIDGPIEAASFDECLGGSVHLVETTGDLANVLSFEQSNGRRVSLEQAASGWFDIAEWIVDGEFARFVTVENAAGGPQFIVPRHVADSAPHVAESIKQWSLLDPKRSSG